MTPHTLATIYAALGDRERAFFWLEKAYEERNELVGWLRVDTRFSNLRSDPRYADLMPRVGLGS